MSIEHWVYGWVLEKHPRRKELLDLISIMANRNIIDFKNFTVLLIAKRMSGEMNTSCGNGLMNFLMTYFILAEAGNDLDKDVGARFEGDDGIVGCKFMPDATIYRQLGGVIKLTTPDNVAEASFCGNVFVPGIYHNVTNPLGASVRFGWTNARKYRSATTKSKLQLLLSKSISLLYEYPGCPILKSLGLYGYRISTESLGLKNVKDVRVMIGKKHAGFGNVYEKQIMDECLAEIESKGMPNVEIRDETRALVEKLYGIDVNTQRSCEDYLDGLKVLQPLELDLPYPVLWKTIDDIYCMDASREETPHFERKGFTTAAWHSSTILKYYQH